MWISHSKTRRVNGSITQKKRTATCSCQWRRSKIEKRAWVWAGLWSLKPAVTRAIGKLSTQTVAEADFVFTEPCIHDSLGANNTPEAGTWMWFNKRVPTKLLEIIRLICVMSKKPFKSVPAHTYYLEYHPEYNFWQQFPNLIWIMLKQLTRFLSPAVIELCVLWTLHIVPLGNPLKLTQKGATLLLKP